MLFADVCAGFFFFWHGVGGEREFLGFLASPWCLVHLGGASFASHPPCVYKDWISKMCLLLDPLLGRRSVGALSFVTPWKSAGQHKTLPVKLVEGFVILLMSGCIC